MSKRKAFEGQESFQFPPSSESQEQEHSEAQLALSREEQIKIRTKEMLKEHDGWEESYARDWAIIEVDKQDKEKRKKAKQ